MNEQDGFFIESEEPSFEILQDKDNGFEINKNSEDYKTKKEEDYFKKISDLKKSRYNYYKFPLSILPTNMNDNYYVYITRRKYKSLRKLKGNVKVDLIDI